MRQRMVDDDQVGWDGRGPGARRVPWFRAPTTVLLLAMVLVITVAVSGADNIASADPSASDWQRLRQCESGGNYTINTGNGYYGAYQFDLVTWQSIGGTGYPNQASPATQDAMALKLWKARGWSPWACASIIGLTDAKLVRPKGHVDAVTGSVRSALVSGWTLDTTSPATSTRVHIYVNGTGHSFAADNPRPDVNRVYNVTGNHGFSETVPLYPGSNSVCVYAIGVAPNNVNTKISCTTVQAPLGPRGHVDAMVLAGWKIKVAGWSFDRGSTAASIAVSVSANGVSGVGTADQPRPDVNAAFHITGRHGFNLLSPTVNRGPNTVCVTGLGVIAGNNALLECRTVQGPQWPVGAVDAMTVTGSTARVAGWVLDRSSPSTSIQVHIYVNGVGTPFVANNPRPDVDRVMKVTGNHGYAETVPLRSGSNTVCVYAIGVAFDNNTQIECRALQSPGAQGMAAATPPAAVSPSAPASAANATSPTTRTAAVSSSAVGQPEPGARPAPSSSVPSSAAARVTGATTAASPPPPPAPSQSGLTNAPAASGVVASTVVTTPTGRPRADGALDPISVVGRNGTVTGWIVDRSAGPGGVPVRITVNGVTHDVLAGSVRAGVTRTDGGTMPLGFTDRIQLAAGSNEVCLYEIDDTGGLSTAPIACRTEVVQ